MLAGRFLSEQEGRESLDIGLKGFHGFQFRQFSHVSHVSVSIRYQSGSTPRIESCMGAVVQIIKKIPSLLNSPFS